ncbi:MAG: cupin domain-containing protein [Gaiellaceae bacterium]
MSEVELVPAAEHSSLALGFAELAGSATHPVEETEHDSLLYVTAGSGSLALGHAGAELGRGYAALVAAGENALLSAHGEGLSFLRATVGPGADRHAPMGPRELVVDLGAAGSAHATGTRSFQILFGPHNGSTRATLFAGFIPPGRAPWHYHLYDEIVWVPEGPGRLHRSGSDEPLGPGSAFRLRPRDVHIVENASPDREMTVIGVFTPAGSPSAAYLAC